MSAIAADALVRDRLYIGGEWVEPAGDGHDRGRQPDDRGGRWAASPRATPEDVDRAVRGRPRRLRVLVARRRPRSAPSYCGAIGAKLAERGDEIAALITTELGMPLTLSRMIQAGLPTMTFASMPTSSSEIEWEEQVGNSLIVREAVGRGRRRSRRGTTRCTRSPPRSRRRSPRAARSCSSRARWCRSTRSCSPRSSRRSACPPVSSTSSPASARSSARRSPPTPTWTWSPSPAPRARGGASRELAAQTVKPVALELGGKSPNVILDDADLEQAVTDGVAKCFLNSGQTCSALTRMLVPREQLARGGGDRRRGGRVVHRRRPVRPRARSSGPLVSETQRERVRGYIEKGVAEGAKLVTGGARGAGGPRRGLLRAADGLLRGHAAR